MINLKLCILLIAIAAPNWAEETTTTTDDTTTTTTDETTTESTSCKDGKDEYCALCVSDKCTVCYASFNDDGMCKAPTTEVENCIMYSSLTVCDACMSKYKLSDGKCVDIGIENCYATTDGTTCASCSGLAGESDCPGTECTIANCASCKTVDEKENCEGCASGFYAAADKLSCVELTGANAGCASVVDSKCSGCTYGYYVNSASSVSPMTCAESTKYSSVKVFGFVQFAILAIASFMW